MPNCCDLSFEMVLAIRSDERVRQIVNICSPGCSICYGLLREAAQLNHMEIFQLLLDLVCNVNENSSTSLHYAVSNVNPQIVELLLSRGANVNDTNSAGESALHIAVQKKSFFVTTLLLSSGANVDAKDNNGTTPLHIAAINDDITIVQVLVQYNCNINVKRSDSTFDKWTPLRFAVTYGHNQVVKMLLENGALVTQHTSLTCLLYVAAKGGFLKVAKYLIRYGSLVNDDKCPPICGAAEYGHNDVLELLLEEGAFYDAENSEHKTVLHLAAENGHKDIVSSLLKCKPDVFRHKDAFYASLQSLDGEIVDIFMENGFSIKLEYADYYELLNSAVTNGHYRAVETFLRLGVDIEVMCSGALHVAVEKNQIEIAKLLINYGADVNAEIGGLSVLHYGIIKECEEHLVALLLKNNADFKSNPCILNTAVKKGWVNIVETMVKNGVNVNAVDVNGMAPLFFAAEIKNHETQQVIVNLLLAQRANANALMRVEVAEQEDDLMMSIPMSRRTCLILDPDRSILDTAIASGNCEFVRALLQYGANPNSMNNANERPLHIATTCGFLPIVALLIRGGADINATDRLQRSALHRAAVKGWCEIGELLIKRGALIDAKAVYNFTPLHCASYGKQPDFVQILVNSGADIDAPDEEGRTALFFTIFHQGPRAMNILLDNGADANFTALAYDQMLCQYRRRPYLHNDGDAIALFHNCLCPHCPCDALKHHLLKLKAAGLFVNKEDLKAIDNDPYSFDCLERCEAEVIKMKLSKICNSKLTLFDFLTCSKWQLPVILRNETFCSSLRSFDYNTNFPFYGSMLFFRFKTGIKRRSLLDKIYYNFNYIFPGLTFDCAQQIVVYLSDEDLINLYEAFCCLMKF